MNIKKKLRDQVDNRLTNKRFTEGSKEAVTLLGMNYTVKVVADMVNLKVNNVQRLNTTHKALIQSLQVQYDDYCIKNLEENADGYRLSKLAKQVKEKTVLLSEAKSLDHIYFELLVTTVRDENTTVSSRIAAYKELQTLIKKIESGASVVKAEKEEEEKPEDKADWATKFKFEEVNVDDL
jgi:hypothetical protein